MVSISEQLFEVERTDARRVAGPAGNCEVATLVHPILFMPRLARAWASLAFLVGMPVIIAGWKQSGNFFDRSPAGD